MSYNSKLKKWLVDRGYTSQLNQAEWNFLRDEGYAGERQTMWKKYLEDEGYNSNFSSNFINFKKGVSAVGPISSLSLADLIPEATARADRMDKASNFLVSNTDAQGDNLWRGEYDDADFTIVDCANMQAVHTTAAASMGKDDMTIIQCDWDGLSTSDGLWYGVSGLTANGSVDWGYDRPDNTIVIRPKAGRNPILNATWTHPTTFEVTNQLYWYGPNKVIFDGLHFQDCSFSLVTNVSGYVCLPMLKTNNCKFTRCTGTMFGQIYVSQDDDWIDSGGGFAGGVRYLRVDGRNMTQMGASDPLAQYGFTQAYMNNWIAHAWITNDRVLNGRTDTVFGPHGDFFQYSTNTDVNAGYSFLLENCIWHADRNKNAGALQGVFGDDIGQGSGTANIHNCMIHGNAVHGIVIFDPSATKRSFVSNCDVGRGPTPNSSWSGGAQIGRIKLGSLPDADGFLQVYETLGIITDWSRGGYTEGVLNTQQFNCSSLSYGTLDDPSSANVIKSGTGWTLDGDGDAQYPAPDSTGDIDIDHAAVLDFHKPVGGWRDTYTRGLIDPTRATIDYENITDSVATEAGIINISDFTLAVGVDGLSVDITIDNAPVSGGSPITNYYYSLNGGALVSLGSAVIGTFNIAGFSPSDLPSFQLFAENSVGIQQYGGSKNIPIPATPFSFIGGNPFFRSTNNGDRMDLGTTKFTVEYRVALDNATGTLNYFCNSSDTFGFDNRINSSSSSLTVRDSSGGFAIIAKKMNISNTSSLNTYRYVVNFEDDGGSYPNGHVKMFFNGVLTATHAFSNAGRSMPNVGIGIPNGYWTGQMEYFQVWLDIANSDGSRPTETPTWDISGDLATVNAHPWKENGDAT